jgi:hypothetical protein
MNVLRSHETHRNVPFGTMYFYTPLELNVHIIYQSKTR